MKVTFYGAARTVTGSCSMIEAAGKKFLVDCGMFQGKMVEQMLNYEEFPFSVNDIDFVILTHAHIDHSGRIPKLYKDGYKNPVYATTATKDLCAIMLPDSGHIQENEIEWVNKKRRRAGKKETLPMYTAQDGIDSLEIFHGINYNETIVISDDISFKMVDAGHMLGSAIVEIDITEDGKTRRVVFSGDLGNNDLPIINDPTIIEKADTLFMESTYGNRLHGKIEDQSAEFIDIILKTIDRGGNVIIPSFAVGRTQDVLYELNKYAALPGLKKLLDSVPIYVDSPLAVNATKVFNENPEYFDEETLKFLLKGDNPLDAKNLTFVVSAEESKALNMDPTPKIIISASGMCEVGRIKHHLKHNLYRPESTILFVGYQAEGTLGKKIMSGERIVKIFGEEIAVNAEVRSLDGFSGHADRDGILEWINKLSKKPKTIFLNHGEYESQLGLKDAIQEKFGVEAIIPIMEESYLLDGTPTKTVHTYNSTRFDILEELASLKQNMDDISNAVKSELKNTLAPEELISIKAKLLELQEMTVKLKGIKNPPKKEIPEDVLQGEEKTIITDADIEKSILESKKVKRVVKKTKTRARAVKKAVSKTTRKLTKKS